ncbi:MAG: NUDIX domain-containing protein, partial [Armatimonadota bacterium]
LMELGATVCRKAKPACGSCPVQKWCKAFDNGTVLQRPVVKAKAGPIEVRFRVLVCEKDGLYGERRVPEGDWWQGLWEFPRVLADVEFADANWQYLGNVKTVVTKHKVTMEVFRVDGLEGVDWKTAGEVDALALSSPMRKVWALARGS